MRFIVQVADGQPIRQVRLSPLERSILGQLVCCHSNKTIADILDIRPQTVRNYLRALSVGLEATGRAQLVRWALLYPRVLAGAAAPVTLHAAGCRCESAYCQAAASLVTQPHGHLRNLAAGHRTVENNSSARASFPGGDGIALLESMKADARAGNGQRRAEEQQVAEL